MRFRDGRGSCLAGNGTIRRKHQMNKMVTVGLVAALVAGVAIAQNEVVIVDQTTVVVEEVNPVEVTIESSWVSAYVWRGQVLNSGFVAQPQITIAKSDFSLNVWGNYDLEENYNGNENEFSELDVTLAYTLPVDLNEMSFDVGVISYNFPNNVKQRKFPDSIGKGRRESSESTWEIFAKATVLSWDWIIPSVTVFADIDNGDGSYTLFDVVFPYQVSEYLSLEGGASIGYGSTSYNDYYWGNGKSKDAGVNDYNIYFNAGYEIMENLTASLNLTCTFLEGGQIKDAGGDLYENKDQFWGGLNIAYDL